jgi:cytochrome c556
MWWAVGVLGILLTGILAVLVVMLLTARDGDDVDQRAVGIAASLERPVEQLDDAVRGASPSDAASMVALRAAADRAAEDLADAEDDIGALGTEAQAEPAIQELEDGIEATRALAEALASPRATAGEIEGLSADTEATLDDLAKVDLPEVNTDGLVVALRREQRRRAQRLRSRQQTGPTEPSQPTPPAAPTVAEPSYRQHAALGYQTQIPTGPDWAQPADSQPTPGRLFRTSVRGPAGMFLIIDYTPQEPAAFGGNFESRRDVGQTAFGSATEYIFQGGSLPECQRARCVDYIINDPASDSGFAVLAGGTDFALAQKIAKTVMESLVPQPFGE